NETLKTELLYVDFTSTNPPTGLVSTAVQENGTTEFIPFMARIFGASYTRAALRPNRDPHAPLHLDLLLQSGCSEPLDIPEVIPFLSGQISSNEHDEKERVSQGLSSFLLGLCIINIQKTDEEAYQMLLQLIR
ncbi:Vesicle docking protein P115like, partial [Caligus rogercresseyi]